MFTDYSRSLVSLISSVQKHFGLTVSHPTLPELDRLLGRKYRNIVLLLFDGMGTAVLEKHLPPDAFLRKNLISRISSVFPPTTTAATTSVITGRTPIEHGWLGWSLYFEQIDKVVNLYPNTSNHEPAADYNVAGRFIPFGTIFERMNAAGIPAYAVSPYAAHRADTLDELFLQVKELCRADEPKYVYGYSIQPDHDMHDLGTSHPTIAGHLREINAGVERLCSEIGDSLVIVTADHGMTDTDFVFMDGHPEVKECLSREPSIEGRAMSLFIRPGMSGCFRERFERAYGGIYELIPRDEVISRRLFGDGEPHKLAYCFIGDFLAVAKGSVSLGYEYDSDPFRAAHGGGTAVENEIPFIAIETE